MTFKLNFKVLMKIKHPYFQIPLTLEKIINVACDACLGKKYSSFSWTWKPWLIKCEKIQWWWIIRVGVGRSTLGSIIVNHKWSLAQF